MRVMNHDWRTCGMHAAIALGLLGLMTGGTTLARAADKDDAKPASAAPQELPPIFKDLKLTPKQVEQIQATVKTHDEALEKAWGAFHESVAMSIGMEAMMLVAIEDGLSEMQRKQVQQQRIKRHKKPAKTGEAGTTETEIVIIGVTLSDEQQKHANKVHSSYKDELDALREQVREAHGKLVALEADKVISIEHILTEEQLAKLRALRKELSAAPAKSADKP